MLQVDEALERPEILVVDDSAKNRLAINSALIGVDHDMLEAASGEDALRVLLQRDVALILLDVRMPTMDGYETARLIRSRPRSRNVPIIFITAHQPDDAGVREAYRLGAVDFLFKPIRPEVLRAKVSVFVDLHRSAAMIAHQAERLREHDRQRHQQELAEQRRQIEEAALRRQMAEQRRISERLKEADRRKDEFLAILGHELRNPLVPLVVGLRRFADAELDDPELDRARAAMERQVHHLIRLVDDLLDVSRITTGTIELVKRPVRLREIADQALAIAGPAIEARELALDVDPSADDLWVDGDAVRLTQALANLLNNAARYTEPGGRVTLSYGRRGNFLAIAVADTGRGMDEALRHRVFDLFAQERPGSGGLGVGLALTRQLVELHGGAISAASDGPGRGSTFEIRLPAARPPRDEDMDVVGVEIEPPAAPSGERSLRIVVVEDDADLRDAVGELLRGWGHQVELIGTGQEALQILLEAPPDVAVVDIGLPDIDGYEVAQHVRSAGQAPPPRLIAMTGFGQKQDRKRALAAGFDEHITKPPELDALREMLRSAS